MASVDILITSAAVSMDASEITIITRMLNLGEACKD